MSFKFNMQKVLNYREQLEEEAKARLGKAQLELSKGQERIRQICDEITSAQKDHEGRPVQVAELWLYDQYMKGLKSDLRQAQLQERMLRELVEEARKLLTARAIDRKLLDKLKEKQKKRYVQAEQKQEQNFNDEIATVRYQAPAFSSGAGAAVSGVS